MNNFTYFTPTKIFFGEGSEKNLIPALKDANCRKILLHYGSRSAVKSGLIPRIKAYLEDSGIDFVELSGVVPNPRLDKVYEGIDIVKKENIDFILAVGGGSVIDSGKAIAYGSLYDGDVWDFYINKAVPSKALPVGVVLTLSATGSEMSNSSVITNERDNLKLGVNSDLGRPAFAIMDPTFTMTLPKYQTSCGITDIIMHTLERYFTCKGNSDLTDGIAKSVITTTMENGKILMKEPSNYKARAEVMWAGSLSHNGLTGMGNGGNDFMTHKMEHEISAVYDVAHGAGLAALWGSWARYVYKNCLDRFVKFGTDVMGIDGVGVAPEEVALMGISAMEKFFKEIEMPIRIHELGINLTDDQLANLAMKCTRSVGGKAGAAMLLGEEDFLNIYKMANRQ